MASAQGIRAGRAFVELFADDTKLVRGLRAAERKLKAFGAGVQSFGRKVFGLGAAIVAPLAATTKVFSEMGDKLAKMSGRTGASVEALSELGYAADQSGTDITSLENGLRKMQRTIVEAADGTEAAQEALGRLGLSAAQLGSLAPDEQFALIADRLDQIQNPALKAATAMEIFGKTGTSLLPLMQGGAKGIAELRQQARDLGLTISTEDAKAAAFFTDRLSDLWKVIKSGVFAIGAALAPLLQDFAIRATRIGKALADWVRQNKSLIVTVFKVAAVIAGAGAALIALGVVISGLGSAFGVAAGLITGVGTVLGTIGSILAALLSPVGLVVAAVVALGGYLLYVSGVGGQALQWLTDRFLDLKSDALAAWQGIGDALAAGDIGLAAKILWLTLKMEWQKGVHFLNELWVTVKEFFLSTWTEAVFGASKIATNAWAGLQSAWTETVDFLADAWTLFTTSITKGWHTAVGFIRKAWVQLKSLFDSDLDAEAEITRINEEVAAKNDAVDEERNRRIFQREQARKKHLSEIEGDRSGALEQLDQMREAEHAARQRQQDADLQASEDSLTQARQEWQDAIAEAAKKRSESEAGAGPERVQRAKLELDGMDELLAQVGEQRFSTTGTFNAAAARGLGGGTAAERTASATESTARSVKKLEERSRLGQPAFS